MAWSCDKSSVAPLSDYMDNPVFQELISEDNHVGVKSDERVYLDLRASAGYMKEAEKLERSNSKISLHLVLKEVATRKLRLRVWAHSLGEYLYILNKNGLNFKTEHMQSIKLMMIY